MVDAGSGRLANLDQRAHRLTAFERLLYAAPMAPALVHTPPRALGYCRVSTGDQVNSGAGLDAQRAALQAEAARRGWQLELVIEEGLSAKDLNRPALARIFRAAVEVHDRRGFRPAWAENRMGV